MDDPERWERIKTIVLVFLVVLSLVLSGYLWLPDSPVSSLPSELTPQEGGAKSEEVDLGHLFRPTQVIFHSGDGEHREATPAVAQEIIESAHSLLSSLQPEDLNEVKESDGLADDFLRWQFNRKGVSLLLPGRLPLDLWMWALDAGGKFPSTPVDRVLFFVSPEDPDMLRLYIGGVNGWVHTEWSIVDDFELEEGSEDEAMLPIFDQEDVAGAVALLAETISQQRDFSDGPEMKMLTGWRDIGARSLLGIPKWDPEVETAVAEVVTLDEEQAVRSFFADFSGVHRREDRDGSEVYTDEYSSVRLPVEGGVQYAMVTPRDSEEEAEAPSKQEALLQAYRFLQRTTGSEAENLRLVEITREIQRGTLDWDTGRPKISGYTFHFAQQMAERFLMTREGPVSVTVGSDGVRWADIRIMKSASRVQGFEPITPISALQRCYELLRDAGWSEDEVVVERLEMVCYPAETVEAETERVLRPAWSVDLGPAGRFLVDAVNGDVVFRYTGGQ